MKTTILKLVQFQYKGDDKRPTQSPVRNHPGLKALAVSIERGKVS